MSGSRAVGQAASYVIMQEKTPGVLVTNALEVWDGAGGEPILVCMCVSVDF